MNEEKLAVVRTAYAAQLVAKSGGFVNSKVEEAFSTVPRNKFLGQGSWSIVDSWNQLRIVESPLPEVAFQDAMFCISPSNRINNGLPSLHMRLISNLDVQDGDRVLHLGAGTGYYTAILAHLVGPKGQVVASEIDKYLANTGQTNLKDSKNIEFHCSDGLPDVDNHFDVIYVNYSIADIPLEWVARLSIGGKILFPLSAPWPERTSDSRAAISPGKAMKITGRATQNYAAEYVSNVSFIFDSGRTGSFSDNYVNRLKQSLTDDQGARNVKKFVIGEPSHKDDSWLYSDKWSFCY